MLASVYSSLGAPPNRILRFAVQISNFLSANGVAVFLGLVAMFFYIYYRRQIIVEFCLRLPIVRNLYAMALEIRFCKILSMLLDKGINITEAVELAAATIRQKERVRQLKIFNAALRRGEAISTALGTATEMFSPLTSELIVIGAETGYLPKLLNEAANILEQDLRDRLEKLREILAPILLLIAALVTATVVCSVVGPLFELFSALPEYK
jgi:type IV pilus assembly protein PilC